MKVRGQVVHVVYVRSLWKTRPVFHAWSPPISGRGARTPCGLVIWPEDGEARMLSLPPAHAAAIGRPCERCFPRRDGDPFPIGRGKP